MKEIKLIEVGININDPIGFYSNLNNNLMALLKLNYEGKCYQQCLIEKIVKIVRRSDCVINQDSPPTFGKLSVIFEAETMLFLPGEVFANCIVQYTDTDTKLLYCRLPQAYINIVGNNIQTLRQGQFIPIQISKYIKYTINKPYAIMAANLYIIPHKPKVYNFTLPNEDILKIYIDNMHKEEELCRDLENDKFAYANFNNFAKLLTPYKEILKPAGLTIDEFVNKMKSFNGKFIFHDPHGLSTHNIISLLDNYDDEITYSSNGLLSIINDYTQHLRVIREMAINFKTEELLNEHSNLLVIYHKHKM